MRLRSMMLGLCAPLAAVACDYNTYVPAGKDLEALIPEFRDLPINPVGIEASADRDYRSFLVLREDSATSPSIDALLGDCLVAAGWSRSTRHPQVFAGNLEKWDTVTVCILPGDANAAAVMFEPQGDGGSPTSRYRRNTQAALDKHLAESATKESP